MPFAFDIEMVNLGVERLAYLSGDAGKINHHAIWVQLVDNEAMRFEPAGDCVQILRRETVLLSDLLSRQPMVVIR